MTKKHFEAAARIFRFRLAEASESERLLLLSTARDFADLFSQENPRFDREKFLTACGF